ncbi:MAG: hypothetical protein FVQ77_08935 [Cytophagales bacterium]|nr:hypothetical protein [Cytophagales bacterium]
MIIIASKPGQLGNRLFTFAAFLANAIEHGYSIINPSFDEFARYYPKIRQDFFCRYPFKRTWIKSTFLRKIFYISVYYLARIIALLPSRGPICETIFLDWHQSLDLNDDFFINKAKKKLLFVQGWLFRDEQNFVKHASQIRTIFTPEKKYLTNVENLTKIARGSADLIVGVHIRKGDYKTFEGGKYFYSTEIYAEIMRQVKDLFKNKSIVFLICSDEKQDPEMFTGLKTLFGTGHFIEDLYTLASCDYIMGPPSTFTMWASFYGRVPLYKIVDINKPAQLNNFTY